MNQTLKNEIEKTFAEALTEFKSEREMFEFLKDFLTENELETLAKRLSVAYWLAKKRSYKNIQNNLKVSSSTISEIVVLSKKPGFKSALKKIEADEWAGQWSDKIRNFAKKI